MIDFIHLFNVVLFQDIIGCDMLSYGSPMGDVGSSLTFGFIPLFM